MSKDENVLNSMQLPPEFIIQPKDKIAEFSGEKWPFSNVEPAIYAALGLFYGKTENREANGALVNSDLEYSIHNVLTGHAFGLFNCLPDISLNMGMYGFTSTRLDIDNYSKEEITSIIKQNIFCGNVVHIDEGNGPYDYLIWGYKDNGNLLRGYRFEHGDDMANCAFDFENPVEFDSLAKSLSDTGLYRMNGEMPGGITIIRPDGEKQDKIVLYRNALAEGYRMLTQIEPAPAMDFARVHFGYGQAIYDEWIRQIKEMEKEDCADFLYVSPIFPHFIALYENRLHLWRFLNHLNTLKTDEQSFKTDEQSQKIEALRKEDLQKAVDLCEKLKDLAADAATVTMDGDWNPLRNASNHEKRILLLDSLAKCRTLELEIAESIKKATGG
ncbi:MAG: hypothetical protein ACYCYI_09455 [Saccharofermentanales bacterium]